MFERAVLKQLVNQSHELSRARVRVRMGAVGACAVAACALLSTPSLSIWLTTPCLINQSRALSTQASGASPTVSGLVSSRFS